MHFDLFVLPFSIGLIILLIVLFHQFGKWLFQLPTPDKKLVFRNILSSKTLLSLKEVFLESLLHRKIFKTNPVLGYMHMSLAFGWFLLILVGFIETAFYTGTIMHLPYFPVFFKFFIHEKSAIPYERFFAFMMDLLLLMVISGVLLAVVKRFYSQLFGMKKTTVLKAGDKLALYSLWLIFPLRLLAESATAGLYDNGGFMTTSIGNVMSAALPLNAIYEPLWWAYSFALGLFFVALPLSRYMHIPAEVMLIFVRNYGVRTKDELTSFSELEIHSCSRCGICIDKCQLLTSLGLNKVQAVNFIQKLRNNELDELTSYQCLLCGRCVAACPVGVNIGEIRTLSRQAFGSRKPQDYGYLQPTEAKESPEVIYFAGCMTHLTPGIRKSMEQIFNKAKVNYWFMDAEGSVCCGRPLKLSGEMESARLLIEINQTTINNSKAKLLVTSCPICYRVFREDYQLNIPVMHHSEYIQQLVKENKLKLSQSDLKIVYHDPCELGRGTGVYQAPRELLKGVANLSEINQNKADALCCGAGLGSPLINLEEKNQIAKDCLDSLSGNSPEAIVTACPLCKKTFIKYSQIPVIDLAELVNSNISSS